MSLSSFGVRKPVPINLLMVALILSGIWAGLTLRRQFFPETNPESATVELRYPGASPDEIQESLAIKVEDSLVELDEVDELTTTISEGGGGIKVDFREGIGDIDKAIDEVERTLDALTDLPEEAERIKVRELEIRLPVMRVVLAGDVDEDVLKQAIRSVQDDLRTIGGMGEITEFGVRDYEIRVDVDQGALLEHGLSLPEVRDVIERWMMEVPGGTVRNATGNVSIRTMGTAERAVAVRQIVVRAAPDGGALRVSDIAEVSETFVDEDLWLRHNGRRAMALTVYKVGRQDIVDIAEKVRAYINGRMKRPFQPELVDRLASVVPGLGPSVRKKAYQRGLATADQMPPGTELATNSDFARFVEGRLALLVRNAIYGAVLVFATLFAVLNWRVALWVGMGLWTAFSGTLLLMQCFDITLNLLTMFGLIVVLGLLVDDAIVVSENILAHHDKGEPALAAAVIGSEQVAWPVVATVLTTVVAFLPLALVKGQIGDLLGALPMVVACALVMSLVEALIILPSHMGHSFLRRRTAVTSEHPLARFERRRDHLIFDRLVPGYAWLLDLSLRYRYLSLSFALTALIVSIGMAAGGRVPFTFLPDMDSETIAIDLRMPVGTSAHVTNGIVEKIDAAARAQPQTKSVISIVGQRIDIDSGEMDVLASHIAQFFVELKPVEQRDLHSSQVIVAIRDLLAGELTDVEHIRFVELGGQSANPDITVQIRGDDVDHLQSLASQIQQQLATFAGVYDIADDNNHGQVELRVTLMPGAAALGFSTSDIARQVRGAVYGLDAHVFSAKREDIDVRVRLNEATRHNLHAVEHLWVMSPAARPVPLREVATITETLTYATIKRIGRQRAILVTADCAPQVSPESVVAQLDLDRYRRANPQVEIKLAGRQEQQREAFGSLPYAFIIALVMVYVILACLFDSYLQPLTVMIVIPFSSIGVVWGHWLAGLHLDFLSLIGFVALSGIVVNDSLILVDRFNKHRQEGRDTAASLVDAGRQRLRPILLTTVTTVLGLTPLMLEQSFQARFLIPMAISISFGLMASTALILLVLPCLILIVDDLRRFTHPLSSMLSRYSP